MTTDAPNLSAARLFERYFFPLYAPGADLARARTTDANPARNPRLDAAFLEIADAFAKLAPEALGVDLALDYTDASVHRLAAALTRDARDRLLAPVSEVGEVPPFVHLVTHGVAYVAACIVKNHGGALQLRSPLWESLVRLESRAGTGDLAIFQWWLKALSDEEVGEPRLGDRYRLHVEVPTARPEELPVLAPPDRKLPRLTKVRYDAFYRHLKAHLPELRDVGEHFPTAERFAELGFEWLDFVLLGGGRMLLLHGPSANGVHLLWLDAAGFVGSAFFPADAAPPHRVEVDGDKLVVTVPVLGREARHELLWWGPRA